MQELMILGYLPLDFKTDSGEQVVGTKIHCMMSSENPKFVGSEVVTFFLRPDIKVEGGIKARETYLATFNRKGKLIKLELVKKN